MNYNYLIMATSNKLESPPSQNIISLLVQITLQPYDASQSNGPCKLIFKLIYKKKQQKVIYIHVYNYGKCKSMIKLKKLVRQLLLKRMHTAHFLVVVTERNCFFLAKSQYHNPSCFNQHIVKKKSRSKEDNSLYDPYVNKLTKEMNRRTWRHLKSSYK